MQENPACGKYRHEGLPYARELTYLFKDKIATGEFAWAPSSRELPDGYDEYDQNNEGFESVGLDRNEGSGDSDDPTIGADFNDYSVGVGNMNINTSQGAGSARSGEKRKRGGERARKGKSDNATRIQEHLKSMTSAVESHAAAIVAKKEDPYSIGVAMTKLHKLKLVMENPDFYARCCEVLMKKEARAMFLSIPNEDLKLGFFKRMAYKDNPY